MENASKALLIAGSILLFILLSSLAIIVFRRTQEHTSEIYELMLSTRVDNFNQKYIVFEDKKLSIQDVVSIINLAKDNNEKQKMPTIIKVIADSGIIIDNKPQNNLDLLDNKLDITKMLYENMGTQYSCTVSYGDKSNLIEKINIKKFVEN